MYLEPWHSDVFDFLELKKNTGKEEQRARDLFFALWIPDLFMKRVESNQVNAEGNSGRRTLNSIVNSSSVNTDTLIFFRYLKIQNDAIWPVSRPVEVMCDTINSLSALSGTSLPPLLAKVLQLLVLKINAYKPEFRDTTQATSTLRE